MDKTALEPTRTYHATVDLGENTEAFLAHHVATNNAAGELAGALKHMIATLVPAQWVELWENHAGTPAGVRIASWIAGSWVGTERSDSAPPRTVTHAQAIDAVRRRAVELRPGIDAEQFLKDAAILHGTVRDDAVWVDYLDGDPVPAIGWEGLDVRLLGSASEPVKSNDEITKPGKGDMVQSCSRLWGRAVGTGRKADGLLLVERSAALRDAAADPTNRTVADVAQALTGQPLDGAGLAAWANHTNPKSPTKVTAALVGNDASADLSTEVAGKTLRDRIVTGASEVHANWVARTGEARRAADGEILAGTWLHGILLRHMAANLTGGARTNVLSAAASTVATHRDRLHKQAVELAALQQSLANALEQVDPDDLADLDAWARAHLYENEDSPGYLLPRIPRREGTAKLATVTNKWRNKPKMGVEERVAAAKGAGAGWTVWWDYLARNEHLWNPNTDRLLRVVGGGDGFAGVQPLRRKIAGVQMPTFARPHPQAAPAPSYYGGGRLTGRLGADGTLVLQVATPDGLARISARWMSTRLREALKVGAQVVDGQPTITRDDPTSRLAAGVDQDTPVNVAADPTSSTFTVGYDRENQRWLLAVAIKHHTPRRYLPGDPLRLMGVQIGMNRHDVTYAVWETVDGVSAPQDVEVADVHAVNARGQATVRRARRVAATGNLFEFARPVREGSIDLPAGDRESQVGESAQIAELLDDLPVHDAYIQGELRRVARDAAVDLGAGTPRSQLLQAAMRVLNRALDAQGCLARLAGQARGLGEAGPDDLEELESIWPATGGDLGALWSQRAATIARYARIVRDDLLTRAHSRRVSVERVVELDEFARLLRRLETCPTPSRPFEHRTLPFGFAPTIRTMRNRAREAWTDKIASDTVKTALRLGVSVIAVYKDEDSTPSQVRPAHINRRLATEARRAIADQIALVAPLHGIEVKVVSKGVGHRARVVDGREMFAVTPITLGEFADLARRDTKGAKGAIASWDNRVVAAANLLAGKEKKRKGRDGRVYEESAQRKAANLAVAALTVQAGQFLDRELEPVLGLNDRAFRTWRSSAAASQTLHLPGLFPDGQVLVPADAQYEPGTLRFRSVSSRDIAIAHAVAHRGCTWVLNPKKQKKDDESE